MEGTRSIGLNHVYLDPNMEGFSNVSAGLLIRAVGHGLKVAYVDVSNKGSKLTNFLENLSLSFSFINKFQKFHIETFTFKQNKKILRSILPSVEFNNIDEDRFWLSLSNFDLVIFDNCDLSIISKFKILNLIKDKEKKTEFVFTFSNKKDFTIVKDDFDLVSSYNYTNKSGLLVSNKGKKIINLTGDGKGKSTYSFGYIVRRFIEKNNVKLIYFDKGGNFYGEKVFFDGIKKWSLENSLYGYFDYVSTGLKRFDGKSFRFENIPGDFKEAKEGLMLLKTALKKQTPVIAEELNTLVKTGLLKEEEILDTLKNVINEVLITGRYSTEGLLSISDSIINIEELKHYSKSGLGVRKGIDF